MGKIKLGIIGVGVMGTNYIKKITSGLTPMIELTAICDIQPEKLERSLAYAGSGVNAFSDYKDLLLTGGVDSVLVSTPHYLHPSICIDAFEYGHNVLSDKPTGVYTKQVEELNAAAKKAEKYFQRCFA